MSLVLCATSFSGCYLQQAVTRSHLYCHPWGYALAQGKSGSTRQPPAPAPHSRGQWQSWWVRRPGCRQRRGTCAPPPTQLQCPVPGTARPGGWAAGRLCAPSPWQSHWRLPRAPGAWGKDHVTPPCQPLPHTPAALSHARSHGAPWCAHPWACAPNAAHGRGRHEPCGGHSWRAASLQPTGRWYVRFRVIMIIIITMYIIYNYNIFLIFKFSSIFVSRKNKIR